MQSKNKWLFPAHAGVIKRAPKLCIFKSLHEAPVLHYRTRFSQLKYMSARQERIYQKSPPRGARMFLSIIGAELYHQGDLL